ncbi:hypothetical protein [Pseudofulvimonas gallinarii]|uniref:hypothetical protein n=1 Tax=Pseudofulvimonas gallinarii TaxID=634155 RepID=UPI0014055F45|nr:hypothetical protein [Pseudofulvimonas gallinarii]
MNTIGRQPRPASCRLKFRVRGPLQNAPLPEKALPWCVASPGIPRLRETRYHRRR